MQGYDWWKNFLDQSVKDDKITHENIGKNATGQVDYSYFKDNYKMIGIYLSKQ